MFHLVNIYITKNIFFIILKTIAAGMMMAEVNNI
jgi:hypothetical protein